MTDIQKWAVKNRLTGLFDIEVSNNGNSINNLSGGKQGVKSVLVIPSCLDLEEEVTFRLCGDIRIVWEGNSFKNNIEKVSIARGNGSGNLESIEMAADNEVNCDWLSLAYLFYDISEISKVDLSGIRIRCNNLTMEGMFTGCYKLKEFKLPSIASESTRLSYLFCGCKCIEYVDLSDMGLGEITDIKEMFCSCNSLKQLNVSGLDVSKCSTFSKLFYQCLDIEEIDISSWDTDKVLDVESMFSDCVSLKRILAHNINLSNVTSASHMFDTCKKLEYIDIQFDLSNVINMSCMFSGCVKLEYVDTSNWNIGNKQRSSKGLSGGHVAVSMVGMFKYCVGLRYLSISTMCRGDIKMSLIATECDRLEYISIECNDAANSILMEFVKGDTKLKYIDLHNTSIETMMHEVESNRATTIEVSGTDESMKELSKVFGNSIQAISRKDMDKKSEQYRILYGNTNNGLKFCIS